MDKNKIKAFCPELDNKKLQQLIKFVTANLHKFTASKNSNGRKYKNNKQVL